MKTILFLILVMLSFLTPISAAEFDSLSSEIIYKAEKDCSSFNSGEFSLSDGVVTLHDFTGDGKPEEVVDGSQFACSSALTLWGGTGGTFLWVIVDNEIHEFLAHKWRVVDVDGQNVLLLAVHSSQCSDKIGPCYRALVWDDGFRTTVR